jgi:hypothetical protein
MEQTQSVLSVAGLQFWGQGGFQVETSLNSSEGLEV